MSLEDLEFLYCESCSREMALERDYLKEVNYVGCPYCMEPMLIEIFLPGKSNYSVKNLEKGEDNTKKDM